MSGYPFLVLTCPRCHTQKVACEVNAFKRVSPHLVDCRGYLTTFCASCDFPISVAFENKAAAADQTLGLLETAINDSKKKVFLSQTNLSRWINILAVWPEPPKLKVFEFLPPEVETAMTEAETARNVGTPNRMVRAAYRTVIDVATQNIFSKNISVFREGTKPNQTLNNRIDMLTAQHFMTPSMKEWAHGIRDITNEDVHTSNAVSNEEVTEIAEFTDMLLQYLFELPGRVNRAKEKAEQKRTAS